MALGTARLSRWRSATREGQNGNGKCEENGSALRVNLCPLPPRAGLTNWPVWRAAFGEN